MNRRNKNKNQNKGVKRALINVAVYIPLAEEHDAIPTVQHFSFPRRVQPIDVVRTVLSTFRDQVRQTTGGMSLGLSGRNFEDYHLALSTPEGEYFPDQPLQWHQPFFEQVPQHQACVALFEDPHVVLRKQQILREKQAAIDAFMADRRAAEDLNQKRDDNVAQRDEATRQKQVERIIHAYRYEEERIAKQQRDKEEAEIFALTAKSKEELQDIHHYKVQRIKFLEQQRWKETQMMFVAEMETKMGLEAIRRLEEDRKFEAAEKVRLAKEEEKAHEKRLEELAAEKERKFIEKNVGKTIVDQLEVSARASLQEKIEQEDAVEREKQARVEKCVQRHIEQEKHLQIERQITRLKRRCVKPLVAADGTILDSGHSMEVLEASLRGHGGSMPLALPASVMTPNPAPTHNFPATNNLNMSGTGIMSGSTVQTPLRIQPHNTSTGNLNFNSSLSASAPNLSVAGPLSPVQGPGVSRLTDAEKANLMSFDSFEAVRKAERMAVIASQYVECSSCDPENPIASLPAKASSYLVPRAAGMDPRQCSAHMVNGYLNSPSRVPNNSALVEGATGRPIPDQHAVFTFNPRMPPLHRLPPKILPPGACIELGAPTTFVRTNMVTAPGGGLVEAGFAS